MRGSHSNQYAFRAGAEGFCAFRPVPSCRGRSVAVGSGHEASFDEVVRRPRGQRPATQGGEDESTIRLTPGTSGATATPEAIQLELANNLYARKQYQQAAVEYEKYLGQFPSAPDRQAALYRLGETVDNYILDRDLAREHGIDLPDTPGDAGSEA